jgi:iron complex transport system substrate-binding protein
MNRMRRTTALLLVPLALLAACGSDDDADEASASASEAPAEEAATEEAGPHEVVHAMGTTEVPGAPERVVVLDSPFLDASLALGVQPVGAVEAIAGEGVSPYLADQVPDIELVGLITEPNLEAIAALQPDLILGAKVRHEALYGQLSQIAPTVFTESSGTNWKEGLAVTADALNKAEEAEELLADYEAKADEIGEAVGAEEMTASIVRFLLPREIRLYGPESFSGTVLTDIGFDLGDRPWNEFSMLLLSAEQLPQADADVVFSTSYGGRDNDAFTQAFGAVSTVWEGVPAVAEGRQHWVEDREWMLGIGLLGADIILDDVAELLGS